MGCTGEESSEARTGISELRRSNCEGINRGQAALVGIAPSEGVQQTDVCNSKATSTRWSPKLRSGGKLARILLQTRAR